MFYIKKYENGDFRQITGLYQELERIASPSYEDIVPLLHKDYNYCDVLYLGFSDGEISCFYLVHDELLSYMEHKIHGVFLGLSATSSKTKSSGLVLKLYIQCSEDMTKKYHDNKFFWGTTINPTVYTIVSKYLKNIQPRFDGTYDKDGEDLLNLVKTTNYLCDAKLENVNPFVLLGYSKVRYSKNELQRMKQLSRNCELFDKLNLCETNGDRIIFVGN